MLKKYLYEGIKIYQQLQPKWHSKIPLKLSVKSKKKRKKVFYFTTKPKVPTTLIPSKWDEMSFYVGSTSALVVKTTQLSLWLKLAQTLKRNCFFFCERKTFSVSLHFFSRGNSNEQNLPCIPMSTNWLKNWEKHLLVIGGHGHQKPNSPNTHSNRHTQQEVAWASALCPFFAMKLITK